MKKTPIDPKTPVLNLSGQFPPFIGGRIEHFIFEVSPGRRIEEYTLEHLAEWHLDDLRTDCRNLGDKSINFLRRLLARAGLRFKNDPGTKLKWIYKNAHRCQYR